MAAAQPPDGAFHRFVKEYRLAPLKSRPRTGLDVLEQVKTDRLTLAVDTAPPIGIERADRRRTAVELGAGMHQVVRSPHDQPPR